MEYGVTICSVCTRAVAERSCICQTPCPALCSSAMCKDAHKSKQADDFHYILPIAARGCINDLNHRETYLLILKLHYTQSKLIKSLSLLDAAIEQIEESYQQGVMALKSLKNQYLAKVNQLKEVATETFNSAVRETAVNVANSSYISQSDISQWIWTTVESKEDDNTPLFQSEISKITEEEVGLIFAAKVNSVFRSLQHWNLNAGGDKKMRPGKFTSLQIDIPVDNPEEVVGSAAEGKYSGKVQGNMLQRLLDGKFVVPMTPAIRKQFLDKFPTSSSLRSEPRAGNFSTGRVEGREERHRRASSSSNFGSQRQYKCETCESVIIPSKENILCQNFCQCSTCWLQTLFQTTNHSCRFCKVPFDKHLTNSIKEAMQRCHVCGLVLEKREMMRNAPCSVCVHCTYISTKSRFMRPDVHIGKCLSCNNEFMPDKDEIDVARLRRACCLREDQESVELSCEHFACKSHSKWLRRCRACHQQNERQ